MPEKNAVDLSANIYDLEDELGLYEANPVDLGLKYVFMQETPA